MAVSGMKIQPLPKVLDRSLPRVGLSGLELEILSHIDLRFQQAGFPPGRGHCRFRKVQAFCLGLSGQDHYQCRKAQAFCLGVSDQDHYRCRKAQVYSWDSSARDRYRCWFLGFAAQILPGSE